MHGSTMSSGISERCEYSSGGVSDGSSYSPLRLALQIRSQAGTSEPRNDSQLHRDICAGPAQVVLDVIPIALHIYSTPSQITER